ncbi:hypothetical protein Afil01_40630 [Actinorhabdospora filicis]|uniref:Prolipoprotein diacylglyceryltransferase n=1 Tax=Actinorhabdospora filicis TaxID=1785913 RepID=A0A9W6SR76_9ACTN|nr:prolipoprotein diacylglyceryl transferase family protein [Actinorhabdospora filicis]GLZ79256.1 hypothetical protein Afil01_40630 [Actinorhabdospora filicis]
MTVRAPAPVTRAGVTAFRLYAVLGLAAALAVAFGLSAPRGLDAVVTGVACAAGVAAFVVTALAAKVRHGRERLVALHQFLAVLTACALVVWALGADVPSYLDVLAPGVLAAIAVGRLGCLAAGCCHGRVAVRGPRVAYRREHVAEGFPGVLAGVGLVPVQAAEAVVAGALVAAGAVSGLGLVVCLGGYGAARAGLERLRGDGPPSRRRVSPQSLVGVGASVVAAGYAAVFGGFPIAPAFALVAALFLIAPPALSDVAHPRHLVHLAEAVRGSTEAARGGGTPVVVTACGTRVSASVVAGRMTVAVAPAREAVGTLIARLYGVDAPAGIARGGGDLIVVDLGPV